VKAVLALTDRVGENLSTSERDSMLGNFQTTARYEWMFWDMGQRQEQWPI
jgi:thiaminase (transcriptional activator TenA)